MAVFGGWFGQVISAFACAAAGTSDPVAVRGRQRDRDSDRHSAAGPSSIPIDSSWSRFAAGRLLLGDAGDGALSADHARRKVADAGVGLLGGVMAPLSGFSGLAPALWCTLRGYNKDEHRAVLQNFNLIVLSATVAVERLDRPG